MHCTNPNANSDSHTDSNANTYSDSHTYADPHCGRRRISRD